MAKAKGNRAIRLNIEGEKKLTRKLKQIDKVIARKIVVKSMRESMRPILASAKANAPTDSGALRKSIKIMAMKRSRKRFGVLVATGQGFFMGETFYGAFLEFGTVNMPPKPYMRPAFDQHKQSARAEAIRRMWEGIRSEATRGARRK